VFARCYPLDRLQVLKLRGPINPLGTPGPGVVFGRRGGGGGPRHSNMCSKGCKFATSDKNLGDACR